MHTPRFSGQPINAGDFVLLITSSRPIRTSCENVGTVFPLFRPHRGQTLARKTSRALAGRADKNARELAQMLKGPRIRRTTSKKLRTHSKRQSRSLGNSSERLTRLCGAGAPFRPLFCPIPSYLVPGPKIFPFQLTAPSNLEPPHSGQIHP